MMRQEFPFPQQVALGELRSSRHPAHFRNPFQRRRKKRKTAGRSTGGAGGSQEAQEAQEKEKEKEEEEEKEEEKNSGKLPPVSFFFFSLSVFSFSFFGNFHFWKIPNDRFLTTPVKILPFFLVLPFRFFFFFFFFFF